MEPTPDREESMPTAAPEITYTPPQLEEEDENFVLRIPKAMVTRDQIQRFLDRLEFEHLTSKSQMTPQEAEELAREVKRAVYQANRHLFEGP